MRAARRSLALLALSFPLFISALGCQGAVGSAAVDSAPSDLVVRQGEVRPCQLLTGELVAERAEVLSVPPVPGWQAQIRWLAKDGSEVKAGDPVAIFDSGSLASDVEEKKLKATEAERALEQKTAEAETSAAEKRYAIEEKRTALGKARTKAEVPPELLPQAEYQERQRALARAEGELAKAERALATQAATSQADLAVDRISLAASRREIETAERGRSALSLSAPRAGLVLIGKHPWEDRELREGDSVWVGMAIASLPDLSTLGVRARLADVDDGRIAPGMAATCTLDAYPRETLPCRIEEISALAGEAAKGARLRRAFAVRVALAKADPKRMLPGMSVRVEACGAPQMGLLAPRTGLDLAANPPRARLAAGGFAAVRLGACGPLDCRVLAGLAVGQRLRVEGGGEAR
ncbi:MAG: efflux RND transporter periplasmic adaptor subunit [Acidobacteriota bacterium]